MDAKPWWTSKLVWVGAIDAFYGLWQLFADGQISEADISAAGHIVVGILIIVFRAVTNKPLANNVL